MKKLMGNLVKILCLVMLIALLHVQVGWATGSCVLTNRELIQVTGQTQRIFYTLTCTGDGSIAAYTITPSTAGLRGWFLYNVTTNPGTNAPTSLYDITLVSDGEDIAGGKLADRSATATETVAIASTTIGYPMADLPIVVTFANNTANPSTIVITLRFTSN